MQRWVKNWLAVLALGWWQLAGAQDLVSMHIPVERTVVEFALPDTWKMLEQVQLKQSMSKIVAEVDRKTAIADVVQHAYYDPASSMMGSVVSVRYQNGVDDDNKAIDLTTKEFLETPSRQVLSSKKIMLDGKLTMVGEMVDQSVSPKRNHVYSKLKFLLQIRDSRVYMLTVGVSGDAANQRELERDYQQHATQIQQVMDTVHFNTMF